MSIINLLQPLSLKSFWNRISNAKIIALALIGLSSVGFTDCIFNDPNATPSSQTWAISWMPDCGLGACGTNVTVSKGGAITQKDQGTKVYSLDGVCTYYAPISGQWSGTIFKFTMNGGGCGEILQGFTQGTANGEYGKATNASGSITWTFNNSGPITQTWTAHLLH